MAVTKTLRNRIVGFLILLSLVLMVMPLLLDKRAAAPALNDSAVQDVIAINENGAFTDGNGNILNSAETDYATLLAPENDLKDNPSALQAPDPAAAPQPATAVRQQSTGAGVSAATEILTAPPKVQQNIATQDSTEILRAPVRSDDKKDTATRGSSAAAGSKVAVNKQGAYTIQVGVFSQQSNAENAMRKLKAGGIEAYSEKVTVNGKTMVRVYAGAGASQQELQSLLGKVEKLTGAKGRIVTRR